MSDIEQRTAYRPSLHLSLRDWGLVISAFVISRAALFGLAAVAVHLYDLYHQPTGPLMAYCRFDCIWYKHIVELGYDQIPHWLGSGDAASWAFMPLFPMLSGGLASVTGLDAISSLILVANLAFFISLPLMLLCLRQLRLGEDTARFGVWLLAFSPFSAYFVSGYTEPLFMALMLAMFLCAYRRQWLWVGLLGVLLSGTRNLGVMMVFPVLILAWQAYGWRELVRFSERSLTVILGFG